MEPLSGLDAAFLSIETDTSRLHVGAVLVLDPPEGRRSLFSPSTRFAQIRRVIEQRVHLARPLRQRVVRMPLGLHHPVWADDADLDLDDHVRRASLPAPGGPRELEELVADIMGRPLDPDRPLWEMVVVEGLAGGRSALVAKLHHAILDGVSGASLLATFLDPGPRDRPVPLQGAWEAAPAPGAHELLWHAASGLLRNPAVAADALNRGVEALAWASRQGRRPPVGDDPPQPQLFGAPRSSINGAISSRRRFATVSVPVADLDLVRRTFATTSNDVVLAAVAGGVRRMLAARGDLPEKPLVALVPVSMRRRRDAASLGNRLSGMLVSLRTDVDDPSARLLAIARGTAAAKARHRATRGRLLRDVVQLSPPAVTSRVARLAAGLRVFDRLPPPFNLVVSNVPGPGTPLWCAGSRVVALYPVGPVAEGVGLNVTAISYAGELSVGLLGCRRLVPEVQDLAIRVDEAFGQLVGTAARSQPAAG